MQKQLIWLTLTGLWLAACGAVGRPNVPPAPLGEPGSVNYYEMTIDEQTIQYAVVLPNEFTAGETYPVLLALPPGSQTRSLVQVGLDGYWTQAAQERGWIVVSPAAPGPTLYFQGAEMLIPTFLERIAVTYPPEGGKFHIAGISNGGISAFHIAINEPELYHSVMALPGFPPTDEDEANLTNIADLPVAMYVGTEDDPRWIEAMQRTEAAVTAAGGTVSLTIVPDEGHVIGSLSSEELFDVLDSFR